MDMSNQIVDHLNSIRVWPTGIYSFLKRLRVLIRMKVRHKYFSYLITFIVVCNAITLSLNSYGISDQLSDTLETLQGLFAYIFIYEMISSILALGIKKYLANDMHKLESTIVNLSIFEKIYTSVV